MENRIRVIIQTRQNVVYDEEGRLHLEEDLCEEMFATPYEIAERLCELVRPHGETNRFYGTLVYLTLEGNQRKHNGWFSFNLYYQAGRCEGRILTGETMATKRPVEAINEAIQQINQATARAA